MCGSLLHAHCWGSGLQPRHVPWLGIKPQPFGVQVHTQSTELHQPGLPPHVKACIALYTIDPLTTWI